MSPYSGLSLRGGGALADLPHTGTWKPCLDNCSVSIQFSTYTNQTLTAGSQLSLLLATTTGTGTISETAPDEMKCEHRQLFSDDEKS